MAAGSGMECIENPPGDSVGQIRVLGLLLSFDGIKILIISIFLSNWNKKPAAAFSSVCSGELNTFPTDWEELAGSSGRGFCS